MPTPFFADLVRELCQEGGTGPLTPTGAVPGHRRFSGSVPPGTSFHYAIAGIAYADQWEVGSGRIDGAGKLVRDSVSASSNGGSRVDFTPGLKTLALTVGAGWFAASDAAQAALAAANGGLGTAMAGLTAALDTKQPLSTGHAAVATGEATDGLTLQRAGGWVNIPLSALAFRDAAGIVQLSGPLGAQNGTTAAPSIGFTGDPDTGLVRAASDTIGFVTGGAERGRVTADGKWGIGTTAPASRLDLRGASGVALQIGNSDDFGRGGKIGATGSSGAGLFTLNSTSGGYALSFGIDEVEKLQIATSGHILPGSDNGQNMGSAAKRLATIYAGTGAINTSDAREKAWRGASSDAERRAARRIAAELGFYQWLSSIAAKGDAGARFHFGVRAQSVWAIMADEELIDPIDADGRPGTTSYAFLCWDEGEGADAAPSRFGIRPDQLALFLVAAQEQRIAALESALSEIGA